jgi:Homeodomain-like domain
MLEPDALEKLRRMTEDGRTLNEIATALGCTDRTVSYWRKKLKISKPYRQWTPAEYLLAFSLLSNECPYAEVARTLQVDTQQVRTRFEIDPRMGFQGSGNPLGGGRHRQLAAQLGLTLL